MNHQRQLPGNSLSAHQTFENNRRDDKDRDSRDYREQPPLSRIAHQEAVRTRGRTGTQTKEVGVVLIGPPTDLGGWRPDQPNPIGAARALPTPTTRLSSHVMDFN